jgi:hypothetical protein
MCGRYEIVDGKRIFVRFKVANTTPEMLSNLDVRPTQQVPVLLTDHQLTLLRWGLLPPWAKDESEGSKMINARAEGIAEKRSFKRPLRTQRCLLPASAFFEWQGAKGSKVKYRIARTDGTWSGWQACTTFGPRHPASNSPRAPSSPPRPTANCARSTTACPSSCCPRTRTSGSIPIGLSRKTCSRSSGRIPTACST